MTRERRRDRSREQPRPARYVRSQHIHRRGPAGGYLDHVAIKRCLAEHLVPLTPAELHAAIDRLDECGMSAHEIARRLGCSDRTVTRRRAARRQTEGSQPQ
jgi:hypothetical protein